MVKIRKQNLDMYLLLIVIIFNGFITNFIKIGEYNIGTVLNDGLIILFIMRYLCLNKKITLKRFFLVNPMIISYFMYLFLTLFVSILSYKSMHEFFAGIRNHVIYYLFFGAAYNYFLIKGQLSIQKVYMFISKASLVICCFGIFQYLFRNVLPQQFLTLNDATQFTIYGITSYRANGLVGDMLAFGGFSVISMLLNLSYLVRTNASKRKYLILLIPTIACILSYSRISILLYFFTMCCYYLSQANKKISKKILALLVAVMFVIIFMLYTNMGQSLFQRFTNITINNNSDIPRFKTYSDAIRLIRKNALLGLGFGTQMTSALNVERRIVYDGYWWECMLDLGIPCFFFLILFVIFTIVRTGLLQKHVISSQSRIYISAYFFIAIYFFIVSFINSALEAKINLLLMLLLLAMSEASLYFKNNNNMNKT